MKYQKPQVVVLPPAVTAIQGTASGKLHPIQAEGHQVGTPAAYEADE
jgi:hypothetical protein